MLHNPNLFVEIDSDQNLQATVVGKNIDSDESTLIDLGQFETLAQAVHAAWKHSHWASMTVVVQDGNSITRFKIGISDA